MSLAAIGGFALAFLGWPAPASAGDEVSLRPETRPSDLAQTRSLPEGALEEWLRRGEDAIYLDVFHDVREDLDPIATSAALGPFLRVTADEEGGPVRSFLWSKDDSEWEPFPSEGIQEVQFLARAQQDKQDVIVLLIASQFYIIGRSGQEEAHIIGSFDLAQLTRERPERFRAVLVPDSAIQDDYDGAALHLALIPWEGGEVDPGRRGYHLWVKIIQVYQAEIKVEAVAGPSSTEAPEPPSGWSSYPQHVAPGIEGSLKLTPSSAGLLGRGDLTGWVGQAVAGLGLYRGGPYGDATFALRAGLRWAARSSPWWKARMDAPGGRLFLELRRYGAGHAPAIGASYWASMTLGRLEVGGHAFAGRAKQELNLAGDVWAGARLTAGALAITPALTATLVAEQGESASSWLGLQLRVAQNLGMSPSWKATAERLGKATTPALPRQE